MTNHKLTISSTDYNNSVNVQIYVYMIKKSLFLVGILPAHSSSSHFLPIIYGKKSFPFLPSSRSCFIIIFLLIIFLVFKWSSGKITRKQKFVSFVFAWHVRCCETKMVLRMDNLCHQHIVSSKTQTHLYSFCLEERTAEHGLLRNVKLVVISFKTMHYLGFHW